MIRLAVEDDFGTLLRFASDFHDYAVKDKGLKYNPVDFYKYLIFLADSPLTTLIVSENKDGAITGTVAGILSPFYMDFDQKTVTENWWWVDPKHRGGPWAKELLEGLEIWGRGLGAERLIMVTIGSSVENMEEGIIKRYRKEGYKYLETHFVKEI